MFRRKGFFEPLAAALTIAAAAFCATPRAQAQLPQPLVSETTLKKVSDHVYVLIGFPNIGIVVGSRATLVIDTGLGARNGATVARVAQSLSKVPILYLTTTHFHPEHASGLQAFPPNTVLIRNTAQQEELEKLGPEMTDRFRNMSAQNKDLLQDVQLRPPDILFDRELNLDLGGVTARLFWLGAAHTKGDELIFIAEDSVLLPGDIVQDKLIPNLSNDDASAKSWIADLDQLAPLRPKLIVPDHGALGDASLISQERAFLADLRDSALALKAQGKSADDAAQAVAAQLKTKYPDWNGNAVANDVRRIYVELQ
ncbi:MAG: MBL fold metallo-hydrolase [Acidobacteriia bacterium]|nr:MBL fold metallo-hydrolase [Terriglobia bacterium]